MSCSAEEIERKRQEALRKLAQKGLSPQKSFENGQNVSSSSKSVSSPTFSSVFRTSSPKFVNKFVDHSKKPYERISANTNSKQTIDFYGPNKVITLSFVLISSERFNVAMSSYSDAVINLFKQIPTRNYDSQTRLWSFHITEYNLVVSKLSTLKSQNVKLEKLPPFVINCLQKPIPSCDIDLNRLDTELSQTLLPFQLEGLRYGVERNGRCLIADDMGLGKTFQALAVMNYYQSDWPLLIVTTASMKHVWEETIVKYLPSISIMQVQYMTSGKDYIGGSKVIIVSHDLMSRCCEKLLERNFGCIIIDESHTMKNFKAKITQAATKLSKNAKRVVLLSGTPALSRPSELYSQLSLIDERFFGNFIEYARRYCNLQKTNFGLDSSGYSNLQELEIVLHRKFMIRRTKEDVMKCMPKKTQEIIRLDVNLQNFSQEDRETLRILEQKYADTKKSRDKHSLLLTFFSETAKIKIPSVCSYIHSVLEQKTKFLVFAHHQIMLNAIEDMLQRQALKYIRIDGNTTGDQRKYFVDKFQTDDSFVCALLSITAANAGITLTAAQMVIFAELHWNPSILSQAEARAHRIGQDKPVSIQYLLADGTADDSIWPLLQSKQQILNEVGLCKSSFDNISEKPQETKHIFVESRKKSLITNFFDKEPKKVDDERIGGSKIGSDSGINDFDDILNDDFDDVLCNIDI
ncbi:SWI/SNF-related matrix-associated actin-dependent regulator of chromatin subfamily A-like protein 1 [Sitophilus oryzae]|uniref:SWI/SNF-related matrix-associated actin-dependent regulator of chromatin subfamily A-like protein 1 n=1 Tax=Sitophilus oryzae TaxID=7048 RepID=A0A6J2Y3S7_SITOR|nr:SWI/SNF-related matrix-associated actin-dependent regulator of chromatin subfamily A-like protein 1 [Sitophilus oryzae]